MENKFVEVMSKQTDEQLIKIVTIHCDGYEPSAVEAAEQELKNRNINLSVIEEVKTGIAEKAETEKRLKKNKVSSLTRFIHFVVDTIAVYILAILFAILMSFFYMPSPLEIETYWFVTIIILIIPFFSYYIFMEHKFQKSLGKFITNTKVVNANGQKCELNDIIRRTFCRLIPFDRLSFLFAHTGLHDYLSNTTIVKDEKENTAHNKS